MQPFYKARAAANTPTAPPTRAMALVGRGPAGAKPVLGDGAAEPDGEPDAPAPDAPAPDAPERDAVGAAPEAPELSGVCDAAVCDAATMATVLMASKSFTVAADMTVVCTVRSVAST
jgi:hypothetical protein